MQIQVVGCNHHSATIAMRERLAFSPVQARTALDLLRAERPSLEAVLLSTCNRVELYVACENGHSLASHELADFLARFHNVSPTELAPNLFAHAGREAVRHLFTVAGSLDSMVVGEPQILAQVKQAYQLADEQRSTGPLTHAMFQAALKTARRISVETSIHQRRVSIPSVAVADFAQHIFERFDDKKVLVIGAGEMAVETLKYLRGEGALDILVVNRSFERAIELANQWQGKAAAWDELLPSIADADLVITATGASGWIVSAEQFQTIEPHRGGRPLFVLDLAVPRDFDPRIGDRPGVYLYSVDDLREACQRNRRERQRELPRAAEIIEQETSRFLSAIHHRAVGPVVQRLRESWQNVEQREMERLLNKLPHLDEHARREIGYSFSRLVNKLLHPPLELLRNESRETVPTALLDAFSRLFQLSK
ncbi:MAG: glutamyl-tRNA reductase [Pirellulales bacterium]|nr:glutamyl-tRNA reductase [Pirellulales bacterium]